MLCNLYVCATHACLILAEVRRSDQIFLKLKLNIIAQHHVGFGN